MGHTPYGYRIENGKAVIDEAAATQVRELYKNYLSGLSLTNAAKKAGLDPKELAKTVKEYNEGIKSDSDAFGRKTLVDTSGKPIPLDKGPFYIMPATAAVIATYCGLKINKDAKVQNVFGEVIPGLWAAGEMTGGVHGAGYMSGSAFGKAMTFGRIAAKDIAKQK